MRNRPRYTAIDVDELIELLTGKKIVDVRYWEAYCAGEPCESLLLVLDDYTEIKITASGPEGAGLDFCKKVS